MISSSTVQYKMMMSLKCQYIFSILNLAARFMPEHDLIEISGRLLFCLNGSMFRYSVCNSKNDENDQQFVVTAYNCEEQINQTGT